MIIIIDIKCTISVMFLNHPESIALPHPGLWKKSMKAVPHAKKDGDL